MTLQAENVKILHRLQSLLTNASFSGLTLSEPNLSPFHQVFVCGTYVFLQLHQLQDSFQSNITQDGPYASIGGMNLRLPKLQDNNKQAKTLGARGLPEGWEEVEGVLQYQRLLYIPEIIRYKVISCHHNDPLIGHFGIDKIRELVGRKKYWPSLRRDVESYIRKYDVCLTSKTIRYKPYGDLQSLLVLTH